MAIRFFITLMIVTMCVFAFFYFFQKSEKKIFFSLPSKLLLSFGIAAILLAIIMLLNNLSGV